MEGEMWMRAIDDTEIGEDLTSPLAPLASCLHDSFLGSHCSSCFSPLRNPPLHDTAPHHYCSPLCSSHDSSAEFHILRTVPPPTSDLRAALRLLHSLPSPSSFRLHRVSGLLTNRDKLMADREISERVQQGAKAMKAARRLRDGNINDDEDEEEGALCLILTNAVEVRNDEGWSLGIAVYGPSFSFINHSCTPNSCYRFSITLPDAPPVSTGNSRLRIAPLSSEGENGLGCNNIDFPKDHSNYGPKVIVRSIKRIKKGEEITIAYTDLLQPKGHRQSELLSKYCFLCCCPRCSTSPPCYVDHVLQEICVSNLDSISIGTDYSFFKDEVTIKLTDHVDEVVAEYLSSGDPKYCCDKLEGMLIHGLLDGQVKAKEGNSQLNFRLHPLHHLALNAYTTLASAYRVYANNLLALHSESEEEVYQLEVFDMSRKSAAYSLLLAAATCHLYCFESSLIASVAIFWVSAGESLLTLARCSAWSLFEKSGLSITDITSLVKQKCSKCTFLDEHNVYLFLSKVQNAKFENIASQFHDCITNLSQKVWKFLTEHCHYLKSFEDLDFHKLGKSSKLWDVEACSAGNLTKSSSWNKESYGNGGQRCTDEGRADIVKLGVHCLLFGGMLGSICHGQHSYWTSHIQRILHDGGI